MPASVPEDTRRTISMPGMIRMISSASSISRSVGAPNEKPSQAAFCTASSTAVDYANSFYAPSYTLWGARFGFDDPGKTWQVYLDLKNLTNKAYVTAVAPSYDVQGKDTAVLYPGDGFGAFTGVTYNF
mgnify:CR=1 FL=1